MKKEQIIMHKHATQLWHNPQNRAMRVSSPIKLYRREANRNKKITMAKFKTHPKAIPFNYIIRVLF